MGERSRRLAKLIERFPHCCYCGAQTETIDHVPAIQTFLLRRRPRGLEVPACRKCNERTRSDELVAALLTRIYPDVDSEEEVVELRHLINDAERCRPGLLMELNPSPLQWEKFRTANFGSDTRPAGALNANGPLLNAAIHNVAAKLGIAVQFAETLQSWPPESELLVRWYSNADHFTETIPSNLFQMFPEVKTLTQGRWSVADQFSYSYQTVPEKFFATLCMFRKAFITITMLRHPSADRIGHGRTGVTKGQFLAGADALLIKE